MPNGVEASLTIRKLYSSRHLCLRFEQSLDLEIVVHAVPLRCTPSALFLSAELRLDSPVNLDQAKSLVLNTRGFHGYREGCRGGHGAGYRKAGSGV